MATTYSHSTHASNCTASVREFEPHRQLVSVGYDTVKHANVAVKHRLISSDATFRCCQMCDFLL